MDRTPPRDMTRALVQFKPSPSAQQNPRHPQRQPLRPIFLRTHGLLSPPQARDAQRATAKSPLLLFLDDWQHSPRHHDATCKVGVNILGDLQGVNLAPNARYPVQPADLLIPINLSKMTGVNIARLQMDGIRVLADLRTSSERSARPLKDCDDLRHALDYGHPIAFKMQARSRKGLNGARIQVPEYILERPGSTVVAGKGAFCAILPSAEQSSEGILMQTAGKCVLVTFPLTTENASRYEDGFVPNERLHWFQAIREPGAVLRVLFPGDCASLPPQHMRLIMSLGHNGNHYSATALVYVIHRRVVEARKRKHQGGDERSTKKANTSNGPVESSLDPRLRLLEQANVHRAASQDSRSWSRSPIGSPGRDARPATPVRGGTPEQPVADAARQPVEDAPASELADDETLSASSDIDSIDEALIVNDGASIWGRVDKTGLFPN